MDWKRKLSSRKLWVMVAEFVGMLAYAFGAAQTTTERIVALICAAGGIIAYICSEGAVDAANASVPQLLEEDFEEDDEEDEDE